MRDETKTYMAGWITNSHRKDERGKEWLRGEIGGWRGRRSSGRTTWATGRAATMVGRKHIRIKTGAKNKKKKKTGIGKKECKELDRIETRKNWWVGEERWYLVSAEIRRRGGGGARRRWSSSEEEKGSWTRKLWRRLRGNGPLLGCKISYVRQPFVVLLFGSTSEWLIINSPILVFFLK